MVSRVEVTNAKKKIKVIIKHKRGLSYRPDIYCLEMVTLISADGKSSKS